MVAPGELVLEGCGHIVQVADELKASELEDENER